MTLSPRSLLQQFYDAIIEPHLNETTQQLSHFKILMRGYETSPLNPVLFRNELQCLHETVQALQDQVTLLQKDLTEQSKQISSILAFLEKNFRKGRGSR